MQSKKSIKARTRVTKKIPTPPSLGHIRGFNVDNYRQTPKDEGFVTCSVVKTINADGWEVGFASDGRGRETMPLACWQVVETHVRDELPKRSMRAMIFDLSKKLVDASSKWGFYEVIPPIDHSDVYYRFFESDDYAADERQEKHCQPRATVPPDATDGYFVIEVIPVDRGWKASYIGDETRPSRTPFVCLKIIEIRETGAVTEQFVRPMTMLDGGLADASAQYGLIALSPPANYERTYRAIRDCQQRAALAA